MIRFALGVLALMFVALFGIQSSVANPGQNDSSRIRLEARMRQGTVEAKVDFRQEDRNGVTRRRLQGEINRAAPDTTFGVFHKGTQIASITTDNLGNGRVQIESGVPPMQAGEAVSIGKLTGVLQPR
jgi:hypothetical protein